MTLVSFVIPRSHVATQLANVVPSVREYKSQYGASFALYFRHPHPEF